MSRLFDDAQEEYLERSGAILSAAPLAMAAWFNADDIDNQGVLLGFHDASVNNELCMLQIYSSEVKAHTWCDDTGGGLASSSITWLADVWNHGTAVFASSTDRRAFLNGGNKGTNAAAAIPINLDVTTIGQETRPSPDKNSMSGMIAEVALWDLSDWPGASGADKADNFEKIIPSLAKGFSPLFYPLGLKAYWPLVRGLNDRVNGYNMTAYGPTVSPHCRVLLPQGARY